MKSLPKDYCNNYALILQSILLTSPTVHIQFVDDVSNSLDELTKEPSLNIEEIAY